MRRPGRPRPKPSRSRLNRARWSSFTAGYRTTARPTGRTRHGMPIRCTWSMARRSTRPKIGCNAMQRYRCAASFSAERSVQPDVTCDEQDGDEVEQRIDFFAAAAEQPDQRVADDAEADAVGDRKRQRHHDDGEKGRDEDRKVVPVDRF